MAVRHDRVPRGRDFVPYVSSRWIVDWDVSSAVHVVDRASGERRQIFGPGEDPDMLNPWDIKVVDGGVFFVVRAGGESGIMSWDPIGGTRPLQRWYGDFTRGASNFGTDGKDMVWTLGEGKPPDGFYDGFTSSSIMTAPFTTEPGKLSATARRLRSDPTGVLIGREYSFVVGCGYAARVFRGDNGNLIIVRLSDGFSWIPPNTPEFTWVGALGFTCEEFYGLAEGPVAHGATTIARVKLAGLGQPSPPD